MPFDMNDPETKAAIKSAVEEANTALDAKHREVLDELKKTKQELRSKSEINPADLEKAEAEVERLKGELTAATKVARDAEKKAETASKALETESGFTRKLLVENGLKDVLIKGGVKDEDFLDALVTKFSQGANVITEGELRKAMVGDKELSAVVMEYLSSDAGKKFVAAPVNSGGGAGGGGGQGGGKTLKASEFNGLPAAERAAKMAEGYTIVDEAA